MRGRETHEAAVNLFDKYGLFGGKLRYDRGPLDAIERGLRNTHITS